MVKNTEILETPDEMARLMELFEMDLDYSDLQEYLGDLGKLAAMVTGTPISLINLIDSHTQWTVSSSGLDLKQMPRESSVCQYTILEQDSFEVTDLSRDARFLDKFYVVDDPHLKYYYGLPLRTVEGNHLGALCVLNDKSRPIDPEKKELLKLIASEVVTRLQLLADRKSLQGQVRQLQSTHKQVGHDIRGPIGGIIGLAEILQSDLATTRASEVLELITLIRKGGESVLELAESIMSGSEGIREPGDDEFSAQSFCEKLEELYQPQALTKRIHFSVETLPESERIIFPKTKLLQIVGNLISNSIKFTPEMGEVKLCLLVEKGEAANRLIVTVSDSGVGISAEKVAEILGGDHGSTPGTQGESGYGFGLALVRRLVERAQGGMEIRSEVGQGASFTIKLPV